MLTYFLFFFYLFFGTLLLHIIIRRKIFPFKIYHTAAVLFFKIFMGCLYGWVFLRFYKGDDTWSFFNESKESDRPAAHAPWLVFSGNCCRPFHYSSPAMSPGRLSGFISPILKTGLWLKVLAVLNLLSGKNYYVNVLLFDMLTLPGPLLLFKLLATEISEAVGHVFFTGLFYSFRCFLVQRHPG